MKCTVYGTQKFFWLCIYSSMTLLFNDCDLWNDV